MDTLKTFVETLKLTLYEILAVLLPGAILVEAARMRLTVNATNSTGINYFLIHSTGIIYFLILSYVGGVAVQGITNLIFRRVPNLLHTDHLSTTPPKRKQPLEAHVRAKVVVEELFPVTKVVVDDASHDEFAAGYCLSSSTSHAAYDRFLALRDMARALFLAIPVAWWVIASEAGLGKKFIRIGVLVGMIGFLERYFRYDRAAEEALFTQFLADSHNKDREEKATEDQEGKKKKKQQQEGK